MYRLASIFCTTLCAFSLTHSYADDVGFIHEHEISLSSPLDASNAMTSFATEPSFSDSHASFTTSHERSSSNHETHKSTAKKVAIKPFTGKVKGKRVRMRAHADTDSAIVQELNKGELLSIVAEKGDFWVVEPSKEMKAYIYRTYVLDNAVEGNKVNVRLNPSVDSAVLTHLNSGDKVQGSICASNTKWMEINLPSDVCFYVAKQFIENVGSPEIKLQHDSRKKTAQQLLESAQYLRKNEMAKSYPEIDFERLTHNYHVLIKEYADFAELASAAREELVLIQEEYIDKRLAYAETKLQMEEEVIAATEQTPTSLLLEAITDKMKLWEPIEESLYLSWSTINDSRSLDEYYADQKIASVEITGIVEPYTAPVKSKPGDFIIKDKDLPVAYVYSTQINLQNLIGQKVTLKGAPRPNNNFAFPAYFVLSAD
jgi:uncharacterized protein YgiM (DUF1202 family)